MFSSTAQPKSFESEFLTKFFIPRSDGQVNLNDFLYLYFLHHYQSYEEKPVLDISMIHEWLTSIFNDEQEANEVWKEKKWKYFTMSENGRHLQLALTHFSPAFMLQSKKEIITGIVSKYSEQHIGRLKSDTFNERIFRNTFLNAQKIPLEDLEVGLEKLEYQYENETSDSGSDFAVEEDKEEEERIFGKRRRTKRKRGRRSMRMFPPTPSTFNKKKSRIIILHIPNVVSTMNKTTADDIHTPKSNTTDFIKTIIPTAELPTSTTSTTTATTSRTDIDLTTSTTPDDFTFPEYLIAPADPLEEFINYDPVLTNQIDFESRPSDSNLNTYHADIFTSFLSLPKPKRRPNEFPHLCW